MRSYTPDQEIDLICDEYEASLKGTDQDNIVDLLHRVLDERKPKLLFFLVTLYLQATQDSNDQKQRTVNGLKDSLPNLRETLEDSVDFVHSLQSGLPFIPGYRIQKLVGQGGQGKVYRAVQRRTDQTVAVKLVSNKQLQFLPEQDSYRILDRLQSEVKTTAKLNHPNIVKVFDAGACDEGIYFIMQWISGGTLRDLNQPTPIELAIHMRSIVDALDSTHQEHIFHLDIKPSNILIDKENQSALLADFGLARIANPVSGNDVFIGGTVGYMSPEQTEGRPVDHRSDIFSLGVTFLELLREPTVGVDESQTTLTRGANNSREVEPLKTRDTELTKICLKCMEADPQLRYQNCRELSTDLERYSATSDGQRIATIGRRTMMMSPFFFLLNVLVWFQLSIGWTQNAWGELAIWLTIFSMYPLVFIALGTLSKMDRYSPENLALESLWSIWIAKFLTALTVSGTLRIMFSSDTLGATEFNSAKQAVLYSYPMFSALTGFVMISLAPRYWVFLRPLGVAACVQSFIILWSILKGTSLAPILYGVSASGLAVIWGLHLQRISKPQDYS
ncbi:MAG: serine/threonine-protein kinase [Planctomycetota bacterium]|nr:serine/threonine-protein kinase [Planctomycetota bacterium]